MLRNEASHVILIAKLFNTTEIVLASTDEILRSLRMTNWWRRNILFSFVMLRYEASHVILVAKLFNTTEIVLASTDEILRSLRMTNWW